MLIRLRGSAPHSCLKPRERAEKKMKNIPLRDSGRESSSWRRPERRRMLGERVPSSGNSPAFRASQETEAPPHLKRPGEGRACALESSVIYAYGEVGA